ncbi:multiheme c-type cytochrome, partial [Salmonella enterica]|uniref:multiheme c-type cytochrome n=1 Tax=Salmonella enterica TaxID=28901 RepID=UPI003CF7EA73
DTWNWEAEPGTLTVNDFPAPTCATCHFSGFGAAGTTHDAGDRLAWYLFAPVSERRPNWQENRVAMQNVCRECHNENFIAEFYTAGDA